MTKKTRAKVRRALLSLSLVLVMMMAAVGGTIAWLTDSTQSVVNVFNGTKVDIALDESDAEYNIVPGTEIEKDPFVTVFPGSEECYVFVKVVKENNFDTYCSFAIDGAWTELTEGSGIYYLIQAAIEATGEQVSYPIIADDTVSVSKNLTQQTMQALFADGAQKPSLTFTAYAIQTAETGDAANAWTLVSGETAEYYNTTAIAD